MAYYFFMGKTLLPIAPSKLQVKINNNNKTLNLINDGEINLLKNSGLTEVMFDALLPNSKYPFANYLTGYQSSQSFLEEFKSLKVNRNPFQFIVCRMSSKFAFLFDTNIKVALEDYEIIEDANNGFDVLTAVRLKQYKPYATKTLDVKTNADGTKTATINATRETLKEKPAVHRAIANQTLWEVCKSKLGDGSMWQTIAEINNIANPNALTVGQVIKLVK